MQNRTHTCNELRLADAGKKVQLSGWVENVREVGGNLAKILDNIGDTIQERIRMKREIFALTAQGRLSAWVLILLPFLMALFLYIFSPEQLTILIDDPLGRLALMISMVLELIGYVVIQKIVHIDV
jgi:tight adherence protein B